MKIPSKIKVGGVTYSIRWPEKIEAKGQSRKALGAQIDHVKAEIEIARAYRGTNQGEKSFLHELIHAILEQIDYQQGAKIDERFVERFANCLHQVAIDSGMDFR